MKRNRTLTAAFLALLALAALFAGLYLSSRPGTVSGVKAITVEVVHGDGSGRTFSYQTQEDYLGAVLLAEGLVTGEQGPYGLYITEVDGEAADFSSNKAYWALFEGDTYAAQSADQTPIADGDAFSLVYTRG